VTASGRRLPHAPSSPWRVIIPSARCLRHIFPPPFSRIPLKTKGFV
jgi:hypothetical protein